MPITRPAAAAANIGVTVDQTARSVDGGSGLTWSRNTRPARRATVFWADDDPVHRMTTYIPWSVAEGSGLLREEVPHQ